MKKKFLSIFLLLLSAVCVTLQAQPEMLMKVKVNGEVEAKTEDGNTITLSGLLTLPANAFSDITFDYKPIEGLEAIDLGLSVKWANINFKASAPEEKGQLCKWANPANDIVKATWGTPYGWKWRTPTYDEIAELIRGCKWEWGSLNDVEGFWVINKEDEEKEETEMRRIFLPVTGYIDGEFGDETAPSFGYYWSNTLYTNDSSKALAMVLNPTIKQDRALHEEHNILNLFAIRPVWGDPAVSVAVTLGDVSNIGLTTADVVVSYEVTSGDASAVSAYGVEYSVDGETWTSVPATNNLVHITGLAPATTYIYRAYAIVNGTPQYAPESEEYPTFTTEAKTLLLSEVSATAPAFNTATVSFGLSSNALSEVTCTVYYALKEKWEDVANRLTATATPAESMSVTLSGLEAEKTYAYQVVVKLGELERTSEVGEFSTPRESKYKTPEIVDLGLSVKWASFNLGATNEYEKGDLIGWGDITGELKEYKSGIYARDFHRGHIGGNVKYDIAAAELGGHWRLPTPEEVKELSKCSVTVKTEGGVRGFELRGIGSHSSSTIFIPAAGIREILDITDAGTYAYLWTDSLDVSEYAVFVRISSSISNLKDQLSNKAHGMSIRAVWDDGTGPQIEPDKDLTRTIVEGSDKDERTGIIPMDGVKMTNNGGVKWARWNLGAKKQTGDKGQYYAWGETEAKDSYYWSNYVSPYKDRPAEVNGFYAISDEQDAACALWGNGWRMPTEGEIANLLNVCDYEWTTEGGVEGFKFTSRETGESLFFPAGGTSVGENNATVGIEGRYWTRSVWIAEDPDKKKDWATCLYFYNPNVMTPQLAGLERYKGMLIRPVKQ